MAESAPTTYEQALKYLVTALLEASEEDLRQMWGFGDTQWAFCQDLRSKFTSGDQKAMDTVRTKCKNKAKIKKILDRRTNPDNRQLLHQMICKSVKRRDDPGYQCDGQPNPKPSDVPTDLPKPLKLSEQTASPVKAVSPQRQLRVDCMLPTQDTSTDDEDEWHVITTRNNEDDQVVGERQNGVRSDMSHKLQVQSGNYNSCTNNPHLQWQNKYCYATIAANQVPSVAVVPQYGQFYQQSVPAIRPGEFMMHSNKQQASKHHHRTDHCIGQLMQSSAFGTIYSPESILDPRIVKPDSPDSSRSHSPPSLVDEVFEEMAQLSLKDQQLVHDLVMRLRKA